MPGTSTPVVVAVGGEPMDATLKYAAEEALRWGTGLRLVRVVQRLQQGPETVPVDTEHGEDEARRLLAEARAHATEHASAPLEVEEEVLEGPVVASLVRVAEGARTIVLQHRHLSRVRRVVTRSISSGVAARSRVPVTAVPARWIPAHTLSDRSTVTVGVDDASDALPVLHAGLEVARVRKARLRVVHVWSLPGAYEDFAMSPSQRQEWIDRADRELRALVDRADTDGVDVEPEVVPGFTTDVLLDAGRACDLLVVGRHDPRFRLPSHLGPVARALLREATFPVMLVDASHG